MTVTDETTAGTSAGTVRPMPTDDERRAALRRMKRVATSLLIAAAAVFAVSFAFQEQVPWLGQVPVIGTLFRNSSNQKEETELVVVVTPHIVRPAAPGEDLYSPLDQTRSSNDVELFALGILEVDKDMLRRFRNGEGVTGPYGHRLDLDTGGALAVAKK